MSTNPSYLTQNKYGVYYFQLRIPVEHQIPGKRSLIRKSLYTKDRKTALEKARKLWVKMSNSNFDWENSAKDIDRKLNTGKRVYARLEAIDGDDPVEVEGFLDSLSYAENEALQAYTAYLNGLKEARKQEALEPINKPIIVQTIPSAATTPATIEPPAPVVNQSTNDGSLRLSEIAEKWIEYNTKVNTKGKWSASTLKAYKPKIATFIEFIGDVPAGQVTKKLVRDNFATLLHKLPKNLNTSRVFKDKRGNLLPVDEIIEIADARNMERISGKTIETYAATVKSFLRWADKNDYAPSSLHLVLEDYTNISTEDKRDKAFNEWEIKRMFESDELTNGEWFHMPYRHWIPFILLYTGCRLGEVAQLQTNQVRWVREHRTWVFDFTDEGIRQTLKTKNSQRTVPVHNDLVQLGFVNYVKERKSSGAIQLFDGMKPTGMDTWGRPFSRWFNGYTSSSGYYTPGFLDRLGLATNETRVRNTKSFRHMIANMSKQNSTVDSKPRWDYEIWCEITGHSSGSRKTVRNEVYEQDFNLKSKVQEMNKLQFKNLDMSRIKKWGQ